MANIVSDLELATVRQLSRRLSSMIAEVLIPAHMQEPSELLTSLRASLVSVNSALSEILLAEEKAKAMVDMARGMQPKGSA